MHIEIRKEKQSMLSHNNILANFASCLILIGAVLLTAKPAAGQVPKAGQVPTESIQGGKAAETATVRTFLAADTGSGPIFSELDSKGATAPSDKAAAGGANAKGSTTSVKPAPAQPPACNRNITANIVALAQPFMLNRLGAAIPGGLIFALMGDTEPGSNPLLLKADKRPRPLVLRANS